MKPQALILAGLAVLALALALPPAPGAPDAVLVLEFGFVPDLTPPTRLDLVMVPVGDPAARCKLSGGHLAGIVCQGVDY